DRDMIRRPTGPEPHPELPLWRLSTRWSLYYGGIYFLPLFDGETGNDSEGDNNGRVKYEFSMPGEGGHTLREFYEYSVKGWDKYDAALRYRLAHDREGHPIDFRYSLQSHIQRITESTRLSNDAIEPVADAEHPDGD